MDRKGYQKQWRQQNKEKVAAYTKKWNEANKDKRRQIEKDWRERNPDKVKEYNKKAGKKWATNNKGKRLSSVRARQLAKKHRTPPWVDNSELEKFYTESAKLTKETGIKHEVDHIIPLQGEAVSGLHVPWNLQILTQFENRSKGNKA